MVVQGTYRSSHLGIFKNSQAFTYKELKGEARFVIGHTFVLVKEYCH